MDNRTAVTKELVEAMISKIPGDAEEVDVNVSWLNLLDDDDVDVIVPTIRVSWKKNGMKTTESTTGVVK